MGHAVTGDVGHVAATIVAGRDADRRDLVALYEKLPVTADASWWTRQACSAPGGGVLYMGCGAGRLLAPIAAAGTTVVGIDLDPRMIRAAAARIPAGSTLASRVLLVAGRAEAPPVGGRYGAVLLPSCVLNEILAGDARAAAIAAAATRCRSGGKIALQVFNPYWVASCHRWRGTIQAAGGGESVEVAGTTETYDPWRQVHRARLTYRFADGTTLEQAVEAAAVFPSELLSLAEAAGLRVVERWGAHPGTDPLDASTPTWHLVFEPQG